MTYVIDSSVALKWFIPEPLRAAARSMLDLSDMLIAPDFLLAECASALWRKMRLGEINEANAHRIVAALAGGVPELRPTAPLVPHALEIANQLGQPVADCLFVALADVEGAKLATADKRLYDRIKESPWAERGIWIERIGG